MARKSSPSDPKALRQQLITLLQDFESLLDREDIREKVIGLIPSFHKLRDLGCSMMPDIDVGSGLKRILAYFQKYQGMILNGDEFLVVSGIQDYPRRIRELRKQHGWKILSGETAKEMAEIEESEIGDIDFSVMKPDDYILVTPEQDRDSAHRWLVANTIRKAEGGVQPKVLEYLKANVGKEVSGEELRYVANDKSEWARRVRELRTEEGWPIVTKASGRPALSVGIYVLEEDRQSPPHDREIPDPVRNSVLRRDNYTCVICGWNHSLLNRSDTRHLELHHIVHHADGGENTAVNLKTLCTRCHDEVHRGE